MGSFIESGTSVSCVSGHVYDEDHFCELCQDTHAMRLLVIKNRANRKMLVGESCLKEMVRFKVVEVEDLPKWLEKLGELAKQNERRKAEKVLKREEERKLLEKKVIVRKRTTAPSL